MKIIGVMGPGAQQATEEDLKIAEHVGTLAAQTGAAVLTGGMSGVMESAAKGAKAAGGTTIGVGPQAEKDELNGSIDIKLATNMGPGRNYMNIISSDLLVFVSVRSPGTLSELAHATQAQIPSVVVNGSKHLQTYLEELGATSISFVDSVSDIKNFIDKQL